MRWIILTSLLLIASVAQAGSVTITTTTEEDAAVTFFAQRASVTDATFVQKEVSILLQEFIAQYKIITGNARNSAIGKLSLVARQQVDALIESLKAP